MTASLCIAGRIWGKEGYPGKGPIGGAWHRLISTVGGAHALGRFGPSTFTQT
jgi:hypothetical protein